MAGVDHERAFELLPWLVNGTLSDGERESVDAHVRDCVTCRIALREQQRLRAAIRNQPTVPLSPAAGFDALQRELDRRALPARPRLLETAFAARPAYGAAALGVAAMVLLGWLAATGALDRSGAQYKTLATTQASDGVHVDLIFADWVTENDMRALLNEIGGSIVGGPSSIGRYTVRIATTSASAKDVAALVEHLRNDRRVRFAGRTRTEDAP